MKKLFSIIILGLFILPINSQTRIFGFADTIYYIKPISYYFLISSNKEFKPDSSMSNRNVKCLNEGYKSFFSNRINVKELEYDLITDTCALSDLRNMFNYTSWKSIEVMPPLFCLDSIFNQVNSNYILLSLSSGFTRTKENYRSSMAKGFFISALTLGSYVSVPYESTIDLRVVLFNKQTRQIILSNNCKMVDCDPDGQKDIDDQIRKVFKPAFGK